MTKRSPSAILLQELRSQGWHAQSVEKWNAFAKRRIDLFGGIDIVAVHPEARRIVGFQVTSRANMSARLHKMRGIASLKAWVQAGAELIVAGVQQKPREKPDIRYVSIHLIDFSIPWESKHEAEK